MPASLLQYVGPHWIDVGDGASLRFLLPTLSVYALAGAWLLQLGAAQLGPGARAAAVAVVVASVVWGLPGSVAALARDARMKSGLAEITTTLSAHAPAGAVVIAPDAVQQPFPPARVRADPNWLRSDRLRLW